MKGFSVLVLQIFQNHNKRISFVVPLRTSRDGIFHVKVLTKQMFYVILIIEYVILLMNNKGGNTDGKAEEL